MSALSSHRPEPRRPVQHCLPASSWLLPARRRMFCFLQVSCNGRVRWSGGADRCTVRLTVSQDDLTDRGSALCRVFPRPPQGATAW